MLIVKHKATDTTVAWLEEDMQAYTCTCLARLEKHFKINSVDGKTPLFTYAGDQNGAKRSLSAGAKAKACGMKRGEPDIRIYMQDAHVWLLELKRIGGAGKAIKVGGRIDPEQAQRHRDLEALGHTVTLVWASTPHEAATIVLNGLAKRLGYGMDLFKAVAGLD